MNSAELVAVAGILYLLSWFLYVGYAASQRRPVGICASAVLVCAWLVNCASMVLRWWEARKIGFPYIPVSNQYESMVLLGWTIGLIYLLLEWRYKKKVLGVFVVPMAFLSLGVANLIFHEEVRPLMPALRSNWLTAHVITCFLGYAAFCLAFAVSILYLLKRWRGKHSPILERFPSLQALEEMNYKLIAIGFPFLSMGIITGAVWAEVAWGSYWSWDPKEVWSLITWLVYALFLHARNYRGWSGSKAAWYSVIGFLVMLFTYVGVNFLLQGLHSYA